MIRKREVAFTIFKFTQNNMTTLEGFLSYAKQRNPNESEYLQAIKEVAQSIIPFLSENPQYDNIALLERMIEPERIITFRVPWVNDQNQIEVNRGFRIEINSALGPYKGGLRFHPSVNISILKFLAFEQVFKNSLTRLPLGAGKGGANFNPKGRSDQEVMRFCQSFMSELFRHIGENTDIPAGDIGVGAREIGFLFGQYKKLKNEFVGVLTGKGTNWGGSLIRAEATGYGAVYFLGHMLDHIGQEVKGKTVCISGSGNVAQFAAQKSIMMGGKVVTMSDSRGFIYDKDGIDEEKLDHIMELKNTQRVSLEKYTEKYPSASYTSGKRPWSVACQIALPCATQNELNLDEANELIKNGLICVSEGANMPCTPDAILAFKKAGILFAPGKASNSGGVAVSGLEMSQNSLRISWSREEVDKKLQEIMKSIHDSCMRYGRTDSGKNIDYEKGANIAGFVRVADAMLAQGIV